MANKQTINAKEKEEVNNTTYYPTNDYCFKRLFGHKGNEKIIQGLIESVLERKCKVVKVRTDEVTEKDLSNDKLGILDVVAREEDGTTINLEMQMIKYETILKRIIFYWANKYIENIQEGEDYIELKPTKVILIANFEIKNLESLEDAISSYKIIEEESKKIILTEDLEIAIIELPKLKKYGTKRKDAINWLEFIKNPNSIGGDILEKNETLKQAKEEYEKIVADEHERTLMRLRQKHIWDSNTLKREGYQAGLEEGREKGMQEGRQEGMQQGIEQGIERGKKREKIEIAKKMLEANIDLKVIIKITGLTSEELGSLQKGEEKK